MLHFVFFHLQDSCSNFPVHYGGADAGQGGASEAFGDADCPDIDRNGCGVRVLRLFLRAAKRGTLQHRGVPPKTVEGPCDERVLVSVSVPWAAVPAAYFAENGGGAQQAAAGVCSFSVPGRNLPYFSYLQENTKI